MCENIKYEIKADKMASKTGNIAIEISCSGKASGINSTSSQKWGHFVINNDKFDLYLLDVSKLKEMIEVNNFRIVRGGDNYKTELVLIPIRYFQEFLHFSKK